jgi:hypothetical protein
VPDFSSSSQAVGRIPVVMLYDDDPDAIEPLFEQNVVGEFLQIVAAHSGWIEVMALWVFANQFDRPLDLIPESIFDVLGRLRILPGDLPNVLRRSWMDD